jgi:hypothetical protein
MTWEIIASITSFGVAISYVSWRFAKLECLVKMQIEESAQLRISIDHQSSCQQTLVRAVARLHMRIKKLISEK